MLYDQRVATEEVVCRCVIRCGHVSNVLLLIQSVHESALRLRPETVAPDGNNRHVNRTSSTLLEAVDLLILVQRCADAAILSINENA